MREFIILASVDLSNLDARRSATARMVRLGLPVRFDEATGYTRFQSRHTVELAGGTTIIRFYSDTEPAPAGTLEPEKAGDPSDSVKSIDG